METSTRNGHRQGTTTDALTGAIENARTYGTGVVLVHRVEDARGTTRYEFESVHPSRIRIAPSPALRSPREQRSRAEERSVSPEGPTDLKVKTDGAKATKDATRNRGQRRTRKRTPIEDAFPLPSRGNQFGYPGPFEGVWLEYPRKTNKRGAYRAYRATVVALVNNGKLSEDEAVNQLYAAACNYAKYCRKHRTRSQYVRHPATFYGPQELWRDYLEGVPEEDDHHPRNHVPESLDFR